MPQPAVPLLGLVSDTHGYFDPKLTQLLAGVERILHAGDIGDMRVLDELAAIAPVDAIAGNVDVGCPEPQTRVVTWNGLRIRLVHSIHWWAQPTEGVDVVVCGHTHKPLVERRGSVLIVNPGSAGKKRFGLPRTCARMWLEGGQPKIEYFRLD